MKLWIRCLLCLFLFVAVVHAADCLVPFGSGGGTPFTLAGQTMQYSNIGKQCYDWRVAYNSQGFSALSLLVESAPNSSGSPGTWVTFAAPEITTNPISGINPNTNTTAASAFFKGAPAFIRVRLASATGTGTITGILYGCQEPGCGSGTPFSLGGATGCVAPCAVEGVDAAGVAPTVPPVAVSVFDGTNGQRAKSDTSGDLFIAGPDANGAPPTKNPVVIAVTDGTNLNRLKGSSATNNSAANNNNALSIEKGSRWSVVSTPGANSQASASKAAGGAGVRHITDCITFSALAGTAPAATALVVNLRDGATGAGTILMTWAAEITATANNQSVPPHSVCGLNLPGSANTAMTLEFSAGVTNVSQTVTITGYDVN